MSLRFPDSMHLKDIKSIRITDTLIVMTSQTDVVTEIARDPIIPKIKITDEHLVALKRALIKLPYNIAMDNATFHGAVPTDQNKSRGFTLWRVKVWESGTFTFCHRLIQGLT